MNKALKITFGPDEYLCLLTEDGDLDQILCFPRDRKIGTIVQFESLPWTLRNEIENQLDPHYQ